MKCCSPFHSKKLEVIKHFQSLNLNLHLSEAEKIYYTNLFFEHSTNNVVSKDKFPDLMGLLGTDLAENFAKRIFDTFSSDKQSLKLEEFMTYINIYHHGNEHERCLVTFQFIDSNNDGIVNYKEFEDYLNLIISAVIRVHPGAGADLLSPKEIRLLFNKISKQSDIFTFKDFQEMYFHKPALLSWIDYFKNNDSETLRMVNRYMKILISLIEKFNMNMSKIFDKLISLNGQGIDFKEATKEIKKFCNVIEKIRKKLVHLTSSFNIREVFHNMTQTSDDVKFSKSPIHLKKTTTFLTDNVLWKMSDIKKPTQGDVFSNSPSIGKNGLSEDNVRLGRKETISNNNNYYYDENHNQTKIYSEFFQELKKKILEENENENISKENSIPKKVKESIIIEEEGDHSSMNFVDKTHRQKLGVTLDPPRKIILHPMVNEYEDEIDKELNEVHEEEGIEEKKLNILKSGICNQQFCVFPRFLPQAQYSVHKAGEMITDAKKSGPSELNEPQAYAIANSSESQSQSESYIHIIPFGVDKNIQVPKNICPHAFDKNESLLNLIEEFKNLFDTNICMVKWLYSSYNWIENTFLKSLGNQRALRHSSTFNRVNKVSLFKNNQLKPTGENFSIVLDMIMGIQLSINGTAKIDLNSDSEFKNYLNSSKFTLPSSNFRSSHLEGTFYIHSYAEVLFYNIRNFFDVDKETYIQSFSSQDFITELMLSSTSIIEELVSTSKSGSLFYYSRDGKFILKTISLDEYKFLKQIFPNYFRHLLTNKNTLLPKIFGCYKLIRKFNGKKQKYYFLTMNNVFSTHREIHLKYDLKGSKLGREVLSKLPLNERHLDQYPFALKDKDLDNNKHKLIVGEKKETILNQLRMDSDFLRRNKIIDYSLLVGIHILDKTKTVIEEITNTVKDVTVDENRLKYKGSMADPYLIRTIRQKFSRCDPKGKKSPETYPNMRKETNISPDNNRKDDMSLLSYTIPTDDSINEEQQQKENEDISSFKDLPDGGIKSSDFSAVYYIGIIDVLTKFSTKKKLEYAAKLMCLCSKGMSCAPPEKYRDRFLEYLNEVFVKK